jgi:hypothetical protein
MFQMLGVFAEFERGIIRERVNAGLARARANGTKLGRCRVKPAVEARILELKANGDGILKIGRKLGIGTSVVQRVFKQERGASLIGCAGPVYEASFISVTTPKSDGLRRLGHKSFASVLVVRERCFHFNERAVQRHR